jgi:hypothetical protein
MISQIGIVTIIDTILSPIFKLESLYSSTNPLKSASLRIIPISISSLVLLSIVCKLQKQKLRTIIIKILFVVGILNIAIFIWYAFILCETDYKFIAPVSNIIVYGVPIIGLYACISLFIKLKNKKDISDKEPLIIFMSKSILVIAFVFSTFSIIVGYEPNSIDEKHFSYNGKQYVCQIEMPFLSSASDHKYIYYEKENLIMMRRTNELEGNLNIYI